MANSVDLGVNIVADDKEFRRNLEAILKGLGTGTGSTGGPQSPAATGVPVKQGGGGTIPDPNASSSGGGRSVYSGGASGGGAMAFAASGAARLGGIARQNVAGVFDPNLTAVQQQANLAASTIGAIPYVGEVGQTIFNNLAAQQLAVENQTQSGLNSVFGSALEGLRLQNPNATKDELFEMAESRFGSSVDKLQSYYKAKSEGQVFGQEFLAKRSGASIDTEALGEQSIAQATRLILGSSKEQNESMTDKLGERLDKTIDRLGEKLERALKPSGLGQTS